MRYPCPRMSPVLPNVTDCRETCRDQPPASMDRRALAVVVERDRGRQRVADHLAIGRNLRRPGIGIDHARRREFRVDRMRLFGGGAKAPG